MLQFCTYNNNFTFFGLNASTVVNADAVRLGGGKKTIRSSRLPPPNHLSKTLNEALTVPALTSRSESKDQNIVLTLLDDTCAR